MAGELGEKVMFVTYSFRQVFNEFLLSRCQWAGVLLLLVGCRDVQGSDPVLKELNYSQWHT